MGSAACDAPSMKVSVIVCTFNRCKSLERALESLVGSELPKSVQWEILIVDNNSSDETRSVAEKFCSTYPTRFRYFFEPHQGKSFALNSGIREGKGEILAFVDDDVTVQPTWLQSLIDPFMMHSGQDAEDASCRNRVSLLRPGLRLRAP